MNDRRLIRLGSRAALGIIALMLCGFDYGAEWRRLEWEGAWVSATIQRVEPQLVLLRVTQDVMAPRSRKVALPAGTLIRCERVGVRGSRMAAACRSARRPGGSEVWEPLYGWLSAQNGAAGIPVTLGAGKRAGIALIDEPQLDKLVAETQRLTSPVID